MLNICVLPPKTFSDHMKIFSDLLKTYSDPPKTFSDTPHNYLYRLNTFFQCL